MPSNIWNDFDVETVRGFIVQAISRFITSDKILLDLPNTPSNIDSKLHEVCISHKLAIHLENILREQFLIPEGVAIDIEYNRHGGDVKSDSARNNIRPDILIHSRGNDDQNLLVIELKKDTNLGIRNSHLNDDITRIKEMCKQNGDYRYLFGFVLVAEPTTIRMEYSFTED